MIRYGAVEAGGTKMVLTVCGEDLKPLEKAVLPTEEPGRTLPAMIDFFRDKGISALGIGSFGPLQLNLAAPDYGSITTTPKLAWRSVPILRAMTDALNVPGEIDTDVNAAALAEFELGAAKGLRSCLYVTVGTGIGGGVVCEGQLVHGLLHPEFGHMLLRPDPADPMPDGVCPYHKGCLEGLASGPAMERRWGESAKTLPENHDGWRIEAEYLAQMCANAVCCTARPCSRAYGSVPARCWAAIFRTSGF